MNRIDVLRALSAEAVRIDALQAGLVWYLFGSILRNPLHAADIDVAILCPSHEAAIRARSELQGLSSELPLHLFILTIEEEDQLRFIQTTPREKIFPSIEKLPAGRTHQHQPNAKRSYIHS